MLALAVAAERVCKVITGKTAVGSMLFSKMPATFPTIARISCVSVIVACVALGHSAVLNKELTVLELLIMEQALLHQNFGF